MARHRPTHEDFERFRQTIGRNDGIHSEAENMARAEREKREATPIGRARKALTEHGYIFVTVFDGSRGPDRLKQVEKYVHPQSGAIVLLEPMFRYGEEGSGFVEVYVSTPGNDLQVALDIIEQRSRRD